MQKPETPFFVRFLEEQEPETNELKVRTDVKAGKPHTLKYPSDTDPF